MVDTTVDELAVFAGGSPAKLFVRNSDRDDRSFDLRFLLTFHLVLYVRRCFASRSRGLGTGTDSLRWVESAFA